ncbi:MAG: hypothetical protein D4R97_08075, partial [Bacteroidetes bacterium]
MKLQVRKSGSLSLVLIVISLSALAFGVFTMTGLFDRDIRSHDYGPENLADTLIKGSTSSTDTAYLNILRRADALLKGNQFEGCLAELQKALKLKPTDKALNARIAQVRGMISVNKKKQDDFRSSVEAGDAAFQKKDYLNAKAYYQIALNVFPSDSVAQGKLKKTMDLLRSMKAQNTLYDVAVANADRLFQAGEYDRAQEEYENASRILPSEQYPKQKINEIIKIKVDLQLDDGLYTQAIIDGDAYYKAKNWQPALLEYQKASKIRPKEKYPKDKIEELISLVAAQRNKDEVYIKLIASGDQLFSIKSYPEARKEFETASKIKPDQSYPRNKIAEIDVLLANNAKIKKEYEQYISLADSFYIDKNFLKARDYYNLALNVKPKESYPKEMLDKVEPQVAGQLAYQAAQPSAAKLAEIARLKKLDEDYTLAVRKGDSLLALTQYIQARTRFTEASALKPAETYPKEKLALINTALADLARQKALDAEYAGLLASGEKLFKAKSWGQAKAEYQKALGMKPDETLPKKRIASIDSIADVMLKLKSLEEQYAGIIANADKLLAAKTYDQSKSEYQKAIALKPSELYPKTKIQEIDKQLAEIARLKKLDE